MPLYEYKCDGCGKTFEVIQKFADEPLTVHAECGGAVRRLLSSPALQFKGSGWYVTDYAKSGSGDKRGGKSEGKSEGGSDGGSESKPAGASPATDSKPAAPGNSSTASSTTGNSSTGSK